MGVLHGRANGDQVLEWNLCNLFAVLMSLSDSDMKNRVECSMEYAKVEEDLDSLKLLAIIKKLVYTGGTYDLNICNNKAMPHTNLMNLYQASSKTSKTSENSMWPCGRCVMN